MDDDIFDQYYEDLLRVQYKVSESLVKNQHLSCGTIREEFLKDILIKKRADIKIEKGFVKMGGNKSGECDQIFYNQSSPVNIIGGKLFIKPEHCRLVLEIKSNATSAEIKKTNSNFEVIKSIDPDNEPRCGLFCYNTAIDKKTILKRFGFTYDKDLDNWSENLKLKLEYPHIDFVICIACLEEGDECTENQFFLMKDNNTNRYVRNFGVPIIKNFFAITDNLN